MSISESHFDNEREIQDWVESNFSAFLPSTYRVKGCQVTTVSGKHGVPDGFAFDFINREWYVIEYELLSHGVWPHIAEQIVRFVVALQNPATRRKIRDHLFDRLIAENLLAETAIHLRTTVERLLQQLELFIEGSNPQVLIFIDETNQDLKDLAHAVAAQTQIFRIQKFQVNGNAEYYSPDRHIPVITTEPSDDVEVGNSDFEIVELLGGGVLETSNRRFKCYRLTDGSLVHIKRSKFHEENNYYWYGVGASAYAYCQEYGVNHIVFVMGKEGFLRVPCDIVREFVPHTGASKNSDGSLRHYHCLVSPGPKPELYSSNEAPRFQLAEYYHAFD